MGQLFKQFMAVALGGAIGSMCRFGLSSWIQSISLHKDYPWGIFAVNILGCFAIGILYGALVHRLALGPIWRAGILIGVLGGFTTFSSFSLDTINLMQMGEFLSASMNVILTVVVSLVATAGGLWLTRVIA